jgi:RNA polymerase sigma-70 factor (ECF subfamily)
MTAFDVLGSGHSDEEGIAPAMRSRAIEETLTVAAYALETGEDCDALLAESAKSNAGAFGELYERYYVRVYRYVYHRVGHASDAEDITALVFMKALEALPSYRARHNGFAPWLFRIARNAVVDHYRRRRKQNPLDSVEHHAGDGDPVGHVLGRERRAELHSFMTELSIEQRDVVLMRYAADLSFEEIAATLGKKEPAVRMLLHRGLRKLKAVMDDE